MFIRSDIYLPVYRGIWDYYFFLICYQQAILCPAFLISTFLVHSAAFFAILFEPKTTCSMNSESHSVVN